MVDIGAIIQGINQGNQMSIDLFKAYKADKDALANKKSKSQLKDLVNAYGTTANQMLGQSYDLANKNNEAYKQMLADYNPEDYVYNAGEFNKDYKVEDYLNSNKDKILADVAKQAQNTAAGSGVGHSYAAVEKVASDVADKSEKLYNDAYSQMNTERNFDYGKYKDFINQQQNMLDKQQQGKLNQISLQKGALDADQTSYDNLVSGILGAQATAINAKQALI